MRYFQFLFILMLSGSFLFLTPWPAEARRVREGDAVKIDFNPALEGGLPSITVRPLEGAKNFQGEYVIEYYAWEGSELPLGSDTISGKEEFVKELPHRDQKDILGVRITKKEKDREPEKMAEWRALYFPETGIMKYAGSPDLKRPDDFEEYWREAKEKLALVPMDPVIEPVPEKNTETGNLYKVTLNSYWNLPIVCWYYVPKGVSMTPKATPSKKYPAIQLMPGWGAEEPPVDRTSEGYITLSVNPKSHGPTKEFFETPIAHHLWNIDIPEDYYYRAAFMDCIRGIDFLSSRPEVDQDKIGVQGGSQGGAFALAMGALDKRVDCVAANVPYIVNFPDYSDISTLGSGYIFMEMAEKPGIGTRVKKTLSYIDIANLVPDIRVPTHVSVGLQDPVCPPLNGIVVINRIPDDVPKRLFIDKEAEHENSPAMNAKNRKWFREHIPPHS